MATVFIAGSISISHLDKRVQERINKIVSSNLKIVVGDADGADTSIQLFLRENSADNVTVYCTGSSPRNNVADWPVHHVKSSARAGSRAFFTAKDKKMARDSDYGLMVWDCKSTGTLSNVIELLKDKKKSVVFVDKSKDFVTVADQADLSKLVDRMSESARTIAERKIGLSLRIAELAQSTFDVSKSTCEDPLASLTCEHDDDEKNRVIPSLFTESMRLRGELADALKAHINRAQLSQSEAAKKFGVTQPRISDLTRGKIDLFGLDTLVNMAAQAGIQIKFRIIESN